MKVAFVYTESDQWGLGIRLLSSIVRNAGYRTKILMLPYSELQFPKPLMDSVENVLSDSDVVCVSCFSRSSRKARQVISMAREMGKVTLWGGVHATLNPDDCLDVSDFVCCGEGEGMILDLLQHLDNEESVFDIENLGYSKNGKKHINPLRPLVQDLDSLPFYDFSFEAEYHLIKGKLVKVSTLPDPRDPVSFIGSRGCAYDCTYCTNSKLKKLFSGKGTYLRRMSIEKYIDHLVYLKNIFPSSPYFYFVDEDFFLRDLDEFKKFSILYRNKLGIPFECFGSPRRLTEEKMQLLVTAGLWRIRMGIESGSDRLKKEIYHRNLPNEAVLNAANIINKFPEVIPFYFLILSNPYEKKDDLLATVKFISNLPAPYFLLAFNLIFFPGSVLYEKAIADGYIKGFSDSGCENDLRVGLQYQDHSWQTQNLYLNGILYLMEGKNTKYRLGLLPRRIMPTLLNIYIVEYLNKHQYIIRAMINIKAILFKFRKIIGSINRKYFHNKIGIYYGLKIFKNQ